jgi:hypothetical protein
VWATADLNYTHERIEAGEPGFGKAKVQSPKSKVQRPESEGRSLEAKVAAWGKREAWCVLGGDGLRGW